MHQPRLSITAPVWSTLPGAVGRNSVIVSGADDILRSYSKEEGRFEWEASVKDEVLQVEAEDGFVVSRGRESLSVLAQDTGRLIWSIPDSDKIISSAGGVLVSEDKSGLKAIRLSSGEQVWEAPKSQSVVALGEQIFTVRMLSEGVDRLQAVDTASGRVAWSVEDGECDFVTPTQVGVFYSSTKEGAHKEPVTRVSLRSLEGLGLWTYQCQGPLRQAPQLSTDGDRVALIEVDDIDKSLSRVTVLDSLTGRELSTTRADFKVELAFLPAGRLYLGETEFSRVPGEEGKRHRVLDPEGRTLWQQQGKPDWVQAAEVLVTAWPDRICSLRPEDGQPIWSRPVTRSTFPLACGNDQLTLVEGGCRLHSVSLNDGSTVLDVDRGHKILTEQMKDGLLSDHEGHLWSEHIPTGLENFAGTRERTKPFQIPFLSGAVQRDGKDAVFVDWDGDEMDTGRDPLLVDARHRPVTWSQLQALDCDLDGRLDSETLAAFHLWFDLNSDGKVSSDQEISALIGGSFDKGRLELARNRLWLASDSRCAGGHF